MCFSPGFSFGAAVVLSGMGYAAIRKTTSPQQKLFAAIPLLFAFQQFVESVLWLALLYPQFRYLQDVTTYLFLFIAQSLWPFYVPFSLYMLSRSREEITVLKILTLISIALSAFQLYQLYVYPVHSSVGYNHIYYQLDYPEKPFHFTTVLYLIMTIIPPFVCHGKMMRILGVTILISSVFTLLVYPYNFISVWCFFAAIISVVVYQVIVEWNKPDTAVAQVEAKFN